MPSKCNHCGELAIEDDGQVCHSCGIESEDIIFADFTSFSKTRPVHAPKGRPKLNILKKSKSEVALKHGLSALKNLCHVFNIPASRENELTSMLKNIYPTKKFKQKEDVAVLAGCCLFLIQQKNNQSIPLFKICCQLDCTKKKFGYFLRFLKSWLSVTSPDFFKSSADEEESIFSTCEKRDEISDPELPDRAVSFIPAVCKYAADDERIKLVKKTTDLVKLANSCWLYTGRSPHSVVVACAYLCWKSMHPSRKKASFTKFCSTMKVQDPTAKCRIQELKDLLLRLGSKIPSGTENYVNQDNLIFHLDRILENAESLRNDLLGDEFVEEKIDCKEFKDFRYPPKTIPRRAPSYGVEDDPETMGSDVEISDSEIDSYIIGNAEKNKLGLVSEEES